MGVLNRVFNLFASKEAGNTGIINQEQYERAVEFYQSREEVSGQGPFSFFAEERFELEFIENMPVEYLSSLPLSVQADLMTPLVTSHIMSNMLKKPDMERYSDAMAKLHDSLEPSFAYQAWDADKKRQFIDTLVGDELLIEAREKWDEMSVEDRLDVARHVADIEAQIYARGNDYGIKTVGEARINYDLVGTNKGGSFGFMDGLEVNPVMLERFDFAMEWIIHEQFHKIQKTISSHFSSGEMSEKDPLFYDAMVLSSAGHFPIPPDGNPEGMERYRNSPLEAGAFTFEGYWEFVGAGKDIFTTDERFKAYREELDSRYEAYTAKAEAASEFRPEGGPGIPYIRDNLPKAPDF